MEKLGQAVADMHEKMEPALDGLLEGGKPEWQRFIPHILKPKDVAMADVGAFRSFTALSLESQEVHDVAMAVQKGESLKKELKETARKTNAQAIEAKKMLLPSTRCEEAAGEEEVDERPRKKGECENEEGGHRPGP